MIAFQEFPTEWEARRHLKICADNAVLVQIMEPGPGSHPFRVIMGTTTADDPMETAKLILDSREACIIGNQS
jgi:hypothetical protein